MDGWTYQRFIGPISAPACDQICFDYQFNFCDVSGEGEETQTRFFSFSFDKASSDKSETPWNHFIWSLSVLESGVWPGLGPNGEVVDDRRVGTPLAGAANGANHTAVLLYMKGDLDWFANDVGLPHWGSEQCCGLCWADRRRLNYKDMRRWCDTFQPSEC